MQQTITIELENMKFYAYHGHYEIEQAVGNHFMVQLKAEVNTPLAPLTDRLKDALDYQSLFTLVKQEMEIPSHLLEHVAHRISGRVFAEFEPVRRIWVKISKINPPMGGEMQQVSVSLEREKGVSA